MNTALWICASILSAVLLFSGALKLAVTKEKLTGFKGAGWAKTFSPAAIKALGAAEVAGGLGLILPALTGIAPILVPVTACCVVALMIGAAITHGRLGEPAGIGANAVYLVLAAFIAWGRFAVEPFTG